MQLEIHQKKAGPDYHRLKTMVKISIEQKLRIKNFEAINGNYERNVRVLSCSRMREMRREPEIPEARVPVVECLDGPARITSKELSPIHPVNSGILQYACSVAVLLSS